MAFGIVLVVLIVALAAAVLLVIVGYIYQLSHRPRVAKKSPTAGTVKPSVAPDPSEKKTAPTEDAAGPPPAKTA